LSSGVKTITAGLLFAILWGSASTATKKALVYAQPFTISICRFFIAAAILLFIAHAVRRFPFPTGKQWKQLMIYGLLNIAVYLGFFIVGMQFVSAGIASLFIATNPVFISLIAALWLKQPVKWITVASLVICTAGILIASYPLLETSYVTPLGLFIILISMLSYSIASVYFSEQSWKCMHILTINGWQTLFGGIFTLPFFFFYYKPSLNSQNFSVVTSVLWLAIPVSIGAVQLWMFLLKRDPVKASFWLFLCPIFGILIASLLLGEPLTIFTAAGVMLVICGLYIIQKNRTIKTGKVALVQGET
jgi:probable blue pigment (indigoidine) exporter